MAPELHGPYALPGAPCRYDATGRCQFFIEIGRAAISSDTVRYGIFNWPIVLPPQEVVTLTVMAMSDRAASNEKFIGITTVTGVWNAAILEYQDKNYPRYDWRNNNNTSGMGASIDMSWPLNTWFTFSATFRPGSVSGYLSNRGIIDVSLVSGVWPNTIVASQRMFFSAGGSGTFVADAFVHLRELSLTELQAISDYGNVDLRVPGEAPLILPVRTYWPSVLPVAPSYLKRRSLGARSGTREAAL
jgi:hypothetical protein